MKLLIIIAIIALILIFIPARSYSQIAQQNVRIPAKRTYRTTTSIPAPALFSFAPRTTDAVPVNYEAVCREMSYPAEAVHARIEGTVQVRVLVSEGGTYLRHQLMDSPAPALSQTVAQFVRKLSFRPATENGVATTGWVSVPFVFELDS